MEKHMKKYHYFKKISCYFIIFILLIGMCGYSTTAFATNEDSTVSSNGINRIIEDPFDDNPLPSPLSLSENTVKNSYGEWVRRNGVYEDKWSKYNCYAYSIHRAESPNFYDAEKVYRPGDISGQSYDKTTVTINQLAKLVKDDLEVMGYWGVELLDEIPNIDSTQELICIRKTTGSSEVDFHFMRYDLKTDAWYHKPGSSAILKYDFVPSNDRTWHHEGFYSNGVSKLENIIYDSPIIFIKYTKNLINIGESANKSIKPSKDILCEINIDALGDYTLRLNSQYFVEYELYNEDLDVIMSGNKHSETVGFQVAAGTYYLRMNFETYNADVGQVNVSVTNEHTHSYTHHYIWKSDMTHWSYCSCGNEISQPHVVSSSHSTICMLCRGMAGGGLLNSIPGDLPHTGNGSYILPNGIIVLAPEDEEAYLNSTLEFRTGEIM